MSRQIIWCLVNTIGVVVKFVNERSKLWVRLNFYQWLQSLIWSTKRRSTDLHFEAAFTLCDSRPSLLDRAIICQCKHSGARARPRVFLSCASFSATSTARAVSDYRMSQPIGFLLFSAHIHRRKLFHFLTTSSQ